MEINNWLHFIDKAEADLTSSPSENSDVVVGYAEIPTHPSEAYSVIINRDKSNHQIQLNFRYWDQVADFQKVTLSSNSSFKPAIKEEVIRLNEDISEQLNSLMIELEGEELPEELDDHAALITVGLRHHLEVHYHYMNKVYKWLEPNKSIGSFVPLIDYLKHFVVADWIVESTH